MGVYQDTIGTDLLVGTAYSDYLDGRRGADVLVGAAGDDIYVVYNNGETIIERPGKGTDRVIVNATFLELAAGASVELLYADFNNGV